MLDPAQELRLRTLFAQAVEQPAALRAAFVARACTGDPALRRELEAMLAVHDQDSAFLETPVLAAPPSATTDDSDTTVADRPSAPPPRIDGYEELEWLAEGGMGAVWKAQQVRPVRRTVALKVVRKGLDSRAVLTRFEAERQAMARMSHPHIATVHDAGNDRDGRPFLAMEYVAGSPITDFCETNGLGLEPRIALLAKVCHAVEHAHRRGVLHRDLKPSNVLVAGTADEPVPKIIDFGIAKALQGPLGEQSIHTLQGSFLGTPEYMSPEQIDGLHEQVDTRSDVYALGVILYELLTAQLPLPSERLRQASLAQLCRIVREEVPAKPSTRVRERTTATRPRRGTTGWQRLPGELDWIALKALEKEPDRRYASARDLALDLENFLGHRPVSAGPPSGAYRLRKFVQRYRVQVSAAALVLVALVVGLFGTLWFLVEANRRAAESEAARRDADGVRLATEAMLQAEEDPGLALQLALAASERTDHHAVRQAIHRTLPHHRELRQLIGHDDRVRQLRFLPDGRRLLSAANDAAVVLWDVDSGELLHRFVGHTAEVTHIDLDPSGQRLLTSSLDGTARIWEIATGAVLHELRDHDGPVDFVAFSPDGEQVATASRDKTARLHDARTGRTLHVLAGHAQLVSCLAFDPTGRFLVTRSFDRTARVWEVATGKHVRTSALGGASHASRVDGLLYIYQSIWCPPCGDRIVYHSWSSDGMPSEVRVDALQQDLGWIVPYGQTPVFVDHGQRLLVPVNNGQNARDTVPEVLSWLDLATGERRDEPAAGRVYANAVSPDGRYAVLTDERMDLEVVDLERDVSLGYCRRHRFKEYDCTVAFRPDGRRIASAKTSGRIRIWETLPEFAPRTLGGTATHHQTLLAATAEGARAVVEQRQAGRRTWAVGDIDDWQRRLVIDDPRIFQLVSSRDGSRLLGFAGPPSDTEGATAWTVQSVLVFDAAGQLLREVTFEHPHVACSIRPDGREIAFRHPPYDGGGTFAFYDLDTFELQRRIDARARGWRLTWSGDHRRIAACYNNDAETDVLEAATGAVVASIRGPGKATHMCAALDHDGRHLLVALANLQTLVWDLEAATSPDATPVARYTGLVPAPQWCGFAAGGRLAWVGCNNEVHLFEASTGKPFSILRLDSGLADVCIDADDTMLVTLTLDGRAQRWPLDPLAVARQRARALLEPSDFDKYELGTPAERARHERTLLEAGTTGRGFAQLARLELDQGDLDAAIRHYQAACDLGPHAPQRRDLYTGLLELLCRRLAVGTGHPAQQRADRDRALEALAHAVRCKTPREELLALPGIDALRIEARFDELLGR